MESAMFKFPFVLRSKYERLERESQWIAQQLIYTRQEAERLYSELENIKKDHCFTAALFEYYKKHYDLIKFNKTHPKGKNGRFIQIEVKQCA
jgi:ribosomal protein S15P/S13E